MVSESDTPSAALYCRRWQCTAGTTSAQYRHRGNQKDNSLHSSLGSSAPASATQPVWTCTTPTVFIVSESQAPVVASRRDVHHPITTEAEEPIGKKKQKWMPKYQWPYNRLRKWCCRYNTCCHVARLTLVRSATSILVTSHLDGAFDLDSMINCTSSNKDGQVSEPFTECKTVVASTGLLLHSFL